MKVRGAIVHLGLGTWDDITNSDPSLAFKAGEQHLRCRRVRGGVRHQPFGRHPVLCPGHFEVGRRLVQWI